jgi:hypothetical protein
MCEIQKKEKSMDSWLGNSKQRDKSEDLGVDGIILKWILKIDWRAQTGLIWPTIGPRGWGGDFSHGKYKEK